METKECKDCKAVLPTTKFYTSAHGKPVSRCMPCYRVVTRERALKKKASSLKAHMIPVDPNERFENV